MGPEDYMARSTTVCKSVARAAKTLIMVLYGMSRIIGGQSVLGKGWLRVGANESEHATPSKCLNFPTSSFAQNINMPSHNLVACLSVVKMKKTNLTFLMREAPIPPTEDSHYLVHGS